MTPDVRGSATCPTPALVAERLRPLLSTGAGVPERAWFDVNDLPTFAGARRRVEIRLVREGIQLASRRLDRYDSCEGTAQALAVVAATWVGHYAALPAVPLLLPERPHPAAPAIAAAVALTPARRTDRRAPTMVSLAVGSGVVAARAATSAPFLSVEAGLAPSARIRARLFLVGIGGRTTALSPGEASWRRLVGWPGVAGSWGSPDASVEIGVGALVGVAFLEGRGFTGDAHTTSLDLGVAPWARANARLAAVPITFWAGAAVLGWARAQRIHVDGLAVQSALPRIDLMVGGGIGWTVGQRNVGAR